MMGSGQITSYKDRIDQQREHDIAQRRELLGAAGILKDIGHDTEVAAKAAIKRDVEQREAHRLATEAAQRAVEEARNKTWEAGVGELLKKENRINARIVMALGALYSASQNHIALQEEAGHFASVHRQRNPITGTAWGELMPSTADIYMRLLMERAAVMLRSGYPLTREGLQQP